MRAQVHLSTKFLTTQNAHQVGILTTLAGDTPPTRAPINVVLVLVPYLDDAEMVQEREDLAQEAARLKEKEYAPEDRKYMQAFSMSIREGKRAYKDKLRRPGGKK